MMGCDVLLNVSVNFDTMTTRFKSYHRDLPAPPWER